MSGMLVVDRNCDKEDGNVRKVRFTRLASLTLWVSLLGPPIAFAQLTGQNSAQENKPAEDGPSLKDTLQYIVQKLAGTGAFQNTEQNVPDCGGTVANYMTSHGYTVEEHDGSLQVSDRALTVQSYPMSYDCMFTSPDRQRWSGRGNIFLSTFTVPFRDLSLDGIKTYDPKDKGPCTQKSDPCVLEMRLTKEAKSHVETSGYFVGIQTHRFSDTQNFGGFDTTVSTITFWVHESDTTERLKKAFTHAAILSGAKKELF